MYLRARWRASAAPARVGLGAAALLLAVAAGATIAAEHTTVHRQTAELEAARPPGPVTVDAAGCPVGARCRPAPGLADGLAADLRSQFPGAAVVAALRTVDASSGRVYRQTLAVRTERGSDVRLTAACQPAAAAVATVVRRSARTRLDLAGNQVVVSTALTVTLPAAAGCSVTVNLSSLDLARHDEPAAIRLAQAESARLATR